MRLYLDDDTVNALLVRLLKRAGYDVQLPSDAGGHHTGHLWGDVLALFVVAAVLAVLTPRGVKHA